MRSTVEKGFTVLLPVVGGLFRSENRTRNKTNLMVFLRPVVVRDNATSDALMMDRYEAIRALQQATQPKSSVMMNSVTGAPVLPALLPRTEPAPSAQPAQQRGLPPALSAPPAVPTPVPPQPMQQLVPTPMPPNSTGVPLSSAPTDADPAMRMAAAVVAGLRVL